MQGGTGVERVNFIAYEAGFSTNLGYLQSIYAEQTTTTVYPGALFKNPWSKQVLSTIAFDAGVGSVIGAPYTESPAFGYYQVALKQGSSVC